MPRVVDRGGHPDAASRLERTVAGSGAVRRTPSAAESAAVTSVVFVLELSTNQVALAPPAASDAAKALASFVASSDSWRTRRR